MAVINPKCLVGCMRLSFPYQVVILKDGKIICGKGDDFVYCGALILHNVKRRPTYGDSTTHQAKNNLFKEYHSKEKAISKNPNYSASCFHIYCFYSLRKKIDMGGHLKITKMKNYEGLQENEEVWEIFLNAGMTPIFLTMEYSRDLSVRFCNS